jgi:CheY-like chemotaxis protein
VSSNDFLGGFAVTTAPVSSAIGATQTRRRVLVVDDNVDAAELLAESLRRMGHETLVAFDAPEAIRVAADFEPEVALLDIGLPAMDGYELARRLIAQASRPALLVAISGYGLDADRKKSAEAGFAAHLVKPVRVQTLRELLATRS